jgi:hypothetical protein
LALAGAAGVVGLLLALPLLAISLPFHIVRGLTVRLGRRLEPSYSAWNEVIEFDLRFGWKAKRLLNTYHLADDVFHVTTDSDGWRGSARLEDSDMVVFGDSFAWGHGIDDKHHFANLSRRLNIKCIGANGYNLVQEYLWMEHYAPVLKDKLVVWFIYLGNDLHENLVPHMHGYRMPFVRQRPDGGDWEIVASHIKPEKWPFALKVTHADYDEKVAEICSDTFLSERAFSACEFLLAKGKALCDQAGTDLVVCSIPDPHLLTQKGHELLRSRGGDPATFDADRPDRQLARICTQLGVRFIPLKGQLDARHYYKQDVHWNQKGHRAVARLLMSLAETSSQAAPAPEQLRDGETVHVLAGARITRTRLL